MSETGLGKKQLFIGIGVLVLTVGIGLTVTGTSSVNDKRAQIVEDVNAIRTAELSHHSKHELYVSSDWTPQSRFTVNASPMTWTPSPGFAEILWSPPSETFAAFRVQLTESGFTVEAVADIDGDGAPMRVQATESSPATIVTPTTAY